MRPSHFTLGVYQEKCVYMRKGMNVRRSVIRSGPKLKATKMPTDCRMGNKLRHSHTTEYYLTMNCKGQL